MALEKNRKLPKEYRLVPVDTNSPYYNIFARGGRNNSENIKMLANLPNANVNTQIKSQRQQQNNYTTRAHRSLRPIKPATPLIEEPQLDDTMKKCYNLLQTLMGLRGCHIFHQPVDIVRDMVPNYYNIIKNPMDLGTVKDK
uniref:Transcription factor GTE11 n=1 Tax=Lygus hesperus TaxID=30085 RepID=A0A0A9WFJ3_LYGHE